MKNWFMKSPCKHCPFRRDVTPFLHPERGAELAYSADNPYNSFQCHKTTEANEDTEDGEMYATSDSKECAGFMTLQHIECGNELPEGFEPNYDIVYDSAFDMAQEYEEEWNTKHT